jgi:hypothetical protein
MSAFDPLLKSAQRLKAPNLSPQTAVHVKLGAFQEGPFTRQAEGCADGVSAGFADAVARGPEQPKVERSYAAQYQKRTAGDQCRGRAAV